VYEEGENDFRFFVFLSFLLPQQQFEHSISRARREISCSDTLLSTVVPTIVTQIIAGLTQSIRALLQFRAVGESENPVEFERGE
jgi:hypothetical protein